MFLGYAIGFAFRFVLHYHPDSIGIYIAEDFPIVLSVGVHVPQVTGWAESSTSLVHSLQLITSFWDALQSFWLAANTFPYPSIESHVFL